MSKEFPTIGCCGIDCGLCPRFYTDGPSRCPGCGGENFADKHPPCSFHTCCHLRHDLESCALCDEYPCSKYADREKIEKDSFVTHRRMYANHEDVARLGIEAFVAAREERRTLLIRMLEGCDDGRSKSFYCVAAALLPQSELEAAVDAAESASTNVKIRAKFLHEALNTIAVRDGIDLRLRK